MEIPRRQTKEVVRKRHLAIAQDYIKGIAVKDIAKKHNVSEETVYYAVKKLESLKKEEDE